MSVIIATAALSLYNSPKGICNCIFALLELLRCLQQDLLSVVDKYAVIGVELEVELPVVNLFEAKYQNDKAAILANILQCWMDNYSRDSYIQDISAALGAVQEYDLAEVISNKHLKKLGKRKAINIVS